MNLDILDRVETQPRLYIGDNVIYTNPSFVITDLVTTHDKILSRDGVNILSMQSTPGIL